MYIEAVKPSGIESVTVELSVMVIVTEAGAPGLTTVAVKLTLVTFPLATTGLAEVGEKV